MKLNIIIPAAGDGKRFFDAGFNCLKPFLIFKNKTILENIIDGFFTNEYNVEIYIIMQKKHIEIYKEKINEITLNYNNIVFLPIFKKTEGTVSTILEYAEFFDNDTMVLSANCDQLAKITLDEFMSESKNFDGSLLVFSNESSKNWSFVKIANGFVVEVADKNPISDNAILGWYFWKSGKSMIESFKWLIHNNYRTHGEYMQNLPYNNIIQNGAQVKAVFIDKNDVIPLGTPDDYNKFKNKK